MFPVAICATVGLADVTSANIVGYSADQITDGNLNMRGMTFLQVGGKDISIMKDVVFNNPTGGAEASVADCIRIWNPTLSMYTTYYYYVEEGEDPAWHEENWLDEDEDPDVAKKYQGEIPAGQGFWYQAYLQKGGVAKDDKVMTVSGEVENDIVDPFVITDGNLNMFVNPYPVASNIKNEKSIIITNPTGGAEASEADCIRIWNPDLSMYTTYYYYIEDGEDPAWHEENWLDEDEDPDVAKKYQGDIPAGQGFWYQAYLPKMGTPKTDKTIQFVSPFEK